MHHGRDIDPLHASRNRLRTEELQLVLMAGGFGRRLGTITKDKPKPLVEINGQPIIQIILRQYARLGIRNVVVTLHYLGEQIRELLGNGSALGMHIEYVEEERPLGTAGALSLLSDDVPEHVLVSNADLLTSYDLNAMLDSHEERRAQLTVGIREYVYTMPFGEVEIDDSGCICGILEKPEYKFKVSAGVYLMHRDVIRNHIPRNEPFDMPDLIKSVIDSDKAKVNSFLIDGIWLDVGRPADLEHARNMNLGKLLLREQDATQDGHAGE